MTHPDEAGRRLSEALHAQASRGPLPQGDRARPPRQAAPPPPRIPGRMPPPAPRPSPTAAPAPQPSQARPAGSDGRQIVWALVVTLLVGAILGGGLALLSVLLPGVLPAIG